jgi:elongation factor P
MATTADVKVGSVLKFNGEIVTVIEFQHRTPGNLRAFYQGRMRNVKTGKLVEYRFRSGEEVELLRVEYKELQYLYKDGNALVCMDGENFEQFLVPEILFGDSAVFLKDGDIEDDENDDCNDG